MPEARGLECVMGLKKYLCREGCLGFRMMEESRQSSLTFVLALCCWARMGVKKDRRSEVQQTKRTRMGIVGETWLQTCCAWAKSGWWARSKSLQMQLMCEQTTRGQTR